MTEIDQNFNHLLRHRLADAGVHPLDDPVVFGSAVMKLHGLKDKIGDVDLFVTQRAYASLRKSPEWAEFHPRSLDPPYLEATFDDLTLSVFYAWTCRDPWLDVPEAMATSERVGEHLCVKLELVARWKVEALAWCINHGVQIEGSPWEKHIADLRVLQEAGVAVTRNVLIEATT